jgi:hypothetical protein
MRSIPQGMAYALIVQLARSLHTSEPVPEGADPHTPGAAFLLAALYCDAGAGELVLLSTRNVASIVEHKSKVRCSSLGRR